MTRSLALLIMLSFFKVNGQTTTVHDSIQSILNKEKLVNCRHIDGDCMNVYARVHEQLHPEPVDKRMMIIDSDSVHLKWEKHPNYEQEYYLVFYTTFDEFIHLVVVNGTECKLNVAPFKHEKTISYHIISRGCAKSDRFSIKMHSYVQKN